MQREINLSDEAKKAIIDEIKRYFAEEREEEIGDLAAHLLLKFVVQHIGPVFYNQGIKDAITYMTERLDDLYAFEL